VIIYPAMDLMDGRSMRLAPVRCGDAASYLRDPVEVVLEFEEAGAEWVHVADLDGAREGGPRQHGLIVDIALSVSMKLQVTGGFREKAQLQRMFDAGVDRVAVGSLTFEQPELVQELIEEFGAEQIMLSFDVSLDSGAPIVAGPHHSPLLWDLVALYPEAKHLLITDIGSEVASVGPNIALIEEAASRLPHAAIQTSGGIASLDDLASLKKAGAAGAIVGKALWEQRIRLAEALEVARA
jgi:phosphoribosylformimino-5-aminoimidazole carboxamide ribotide isomerase